MSKLTATVLAFFALPVITALALQSPPDTAPASPQSAPANADDAAKPTGDATKPTGDATKPTGDAAKPTGDAAAKAEFTMTSPAFKNNERLPVEYSTDGENVSPEVAWTNAPAGTKSFALICHDPDAGQFIHWIAWNIPADCKGLPRGLKRAATLDEPKGMRQGFTGWGKSKGEGYLGPAPGKGSGDHHYTFTVVALETEFPADKVFTARELRSAMKGHVLGKAELVGIFSR
ncbi:MAG: YbhB/YbcL family Raf kinase inhibitor-like protein [Phycisphaerae bacterium]|nr:YbhB/YbcL family Raf kinase inhibitor-like protein [Phycisphaerae bacterium]